MDSSDVWSCITLEPINGPEPGFFRSRKHFKRKSIHYINLSLQTIFITSAAPCCYSCEYGSEIKWISISNYPSTRLETSERCYVIIGKQLDLLMSQTSEAVQTHFVSRKDAWASERASEADQTGLFYSISGGRGRTSVSSVQSDAHQTPDGMKRRLYVSMMIGSFNHRSCHSLIASIAAPFLSFYRIEYSL